MGKGDDYQNVRGIWNGQSRRCGRSWKADRV